MSIQVGDRLPEADFLIKVDGTPAKLPLADYLVGRKVVLFGVPGAYTPTCSAAHVPSFVRTADALRAAGVDAIACISVNDVHVMEHWGKTTGGTDAGIDFLADGDGAFTKSIGLDFTVPIAGLHGRSQRHAMYVVDGVVKLLNLEEERGACNLTAGEQVLDDIKALAD